MSVPINWHLAPDEVAYVLDDSGAKFVLADAEHIDLASAGADRAAGVEHRIVFGGDAPDGWLAWDELLAAHPDTEPDGQVSGSTMFYTSGTTGQPKGVRTTLLPVGQDPALVQLVLEGLGGIMRYPRDGRTLVMAPHYHSGPFATAAVAGALGNTVYFTRKFDPEEMLRLIQEEQITALYAVPTFFVRLLKLPDDVRAKYDVSSVEYVWHTAAPCPPDVKQALMDWWGPVVHEGYGATEGSITAWAEPEEWLSKPGTIGKPTSTSELIIVDDDGNRITEPNQVGQLYWKSLIGADFEYHNAPEKTKDVHLEPGVFTFGDVGYVDEDGFVFLSDRKIDMIISGGVNIYPAEIESVLITHPAVNDVAVFGIPHEDFGEEVKAAVELAPGAEGSDALAAELQGYCRDRLAGYKVPKTVDFLAELPRTETGKLVKRQLRDPYWEGLDRAI
ncbi:MAG: AMP-binding protein [Actinobacteria bacterium]|nr:AMP-binding protein [Actinomycetota bacterium]